MSRAGFTAAEAGWLSSGAHACAYSDVEWRSEGGAWRAEIPIAAAQFDDGEVDMLYQVNPRVAWVASAVLRIRKTPRARLCVNRAHREQGQLLDPAPHLHQRRSSDHAEVYSSLGTDFPSIAVGGPVHHGQHGAALHYFADRFNIALDALGWVDPPEEVC